MVSRLAFTYTHSVSLKFRIPLIIRCFIDLTALERRHEQLSSNLHLKLYNQLITRQLVGNISFTYTRKGKKKTFKKRHLPISIHSFFASNFLLLFFFFHNVLTDYYVLIRVFQWTVKSARKGVENKNFVIIKVEVDFKTVQMTMSTTTQTTTTTTERITSNNVTKDPFYSQVSINFLSSTNQIRFFFKRNKFQIFGIIK